MTRADQISTYWLTVRDCLVEFFGKAPDEAADAVESLRARYATLLKVDSDPDAELLLYHDEPIHVASDLAGRDIPAGEAFWKRYQGVRRRVSSAALREARQQERLTATA